MWLVREKEREEELRKYNEANGIEDNVDEGPQVYEYKISIWTQIYYNKIIRGVIIILIVALIVPISLLLFMDVDDPLFDGSHTCSYITDYQVLCGTQNTTLKNCLERKCCFNETDKSCFHTVPSYYQYRILTKKTRAIQTSIESEPIMETTPFGRTSNKKAYLYYDKIDKETVSITLSENKPPTSRKKASQTIIPSDYNVMIFSKEVLAVEVNRTQPNEMLLSTAHGPLIISEKYWEWSVDLEAEHLFGMDFLRHPDNETITRVIYKNVEDHTTVPKFIAYRNGSFHGLEIYHSGPLEVSVFPSRLIVLRLLAGDYLTLHLSIGPTIDDILRQQGRTLSYASLPYWVLGVHMCRGGLTNETALHEEYTKTFTYNKNIPYDSDCIHENLFTISRNVETVWTDAITQLKADNKKFIISLAPQILTESPDDSAYKEANNLGILYKTSSNQTLFGNYLNESVAYPDYALPEAKTWFLKLYSEKFSQLPIDGIVLRDNWPVNNESIFKNVRREFQYMNEALAKTMNLTLPWDSLSTTGVKHIENHNSYGYNFALSTPAQVPFVLTASHTTANSFAVHAQNVNVSWANFKSMLQKSISHSLLNGPLFSMPICGSTWVFSQEQNQAVCSRWYLAAATMPLFRISSEMPRRDPYSFKLKENNYMHNLAMQAIQTRYKLLPYYYTVLAEHPMLIRPMFYDFHSDNNTFLLDEQYMIGDSLLVAQPTLFPIPNIKVYFPEIPGGWYEFWGGGKMTKTGYVTVSIVEADLVVYIAGGKIIPIQNKVGNSAEESRKQALKLIVALDKDQKATGKYYMEKNIVQFSYVKDTLKIMNVEICPTTSTNTADKIVNLHLQIYGQTSVTFCNVKDDLCLKLNNEVTITTNINAAPQQGLVCDNK